jgi:transcriptional regulator with XRE-family HTH domain
VDTKDFDITVFGKRIRHLREERGLKRDELAEVLNVEKGTLANYEMGNREMDLTKIFKLCDFFKVPIDFLLGKSDERYKHVPTSDVLRDFSNTLYTLSEMLPNERWVFDEFVFSNEFGKLLKCIVDYHVLSCEEAYQYESNSTIKKELSEFLFYKSTQQRDYGINDYAIHKDGIMFRATQALRTLIMETSAVLCAYDRRWVVSRARISRLGDLQTYHSEDQPWLKSSKLDETLIKDKSNEIEVWALEHDAEYRSLDNEYRQLNEYLSVTHPLGNEHFQRYMDERHKNLY